MGSMFGILVRKKNLKSEFNIKIGVYNVNFQNALLSESFEIHLEI